MSELQNKVLALNRLSSLSKRLESNAKLQVEYDSTFIEYESLGFIEEVTTECVSQVSIESVSQSHVSSECVSQPVPVYYMPHHPVVKQSHVMTKVRPVFDASSQGYNGVSLNDCMYTGPSLLPSLVAVLLRFHRWKVALSADLTKAFLQIVVCEKDRDAHRFLWNHEGRIKTMRFTRVPFGNKCSPFLLNATVKHHLNSVPKSHVIQQLLDNLYVDNWLSGADTKADASHMFTEAKDVMGKAGMQLAKLSSNSEKLHKKFCLDLCNKQPDVTSDKVLGIHWNACIDSFCFSDIPISNLDRFH